MKTWDKLQSNTKKKNKKIIQKQIKKKKQYSVFKILHQEKYLDTSQQKNLIQQNSTYDQIVENLFTSIQIEIENNVKSSNDITMIDKSIRHTSVSREKKLVKKLKNWTKKLFKKLLILFMRQEIHKIIIQNILKFLFSIYKMIFQNLSSKLHENIDNDEII